MKKILLALIVLVTGIFSSSLVFADEIDSQLPIEIQNMYNELDKVTEIDEDGFIYINIDEAYHQKVSSEAIEVGMTINELHDQIKRDGVENTARNVFRSAYIGVYGNYCGKGNKGWNVPLIDDLDAACMMHDMCFKGFFNNNDECNREFRRRLLPIIQVTPGFTRKSIVAIGAYKLFS